MSKELTNLVEHRAKEYKDHLEAVYRKLILDLHRFGGQQEFDYQSQLPLDCGGDVSSYLFFGEGELRNYWNILKDLNLVNIAETSSDSYRVSFTLEGRKTAENLHGEMIEDLIRKKGIVIYKS